MRKTYSQHNAPSWLRTISSTQSSALVFGVTLLLTYAVAPFLVAFNLDVNSSYYTLAILTVVAVATLMLGAMTRVFDSYFKGKTPKILISGNFFIAALWGAFILFAFVAWFSAPRIPLLAAIAGADPETISILREQFLKARDGWQASFVYVNAIISGALIPYSLAYMFLHKMRWRWFAISFFLIFSLSFVEKAFFFKAVFPLIYLIIQGHARTKLSLRSIVGISGAMLFFVTFFSGSGTGEIVEGNSFFSVAYSPQGSIQHLVWRSVAIPLVTAADAIRVLEEQFGGRPLMGATSSFLAGLFGVERIEYERLVFGAQWGQNETGTGSSNSVYITEAFVNFGWIGVIFFSYVVGLLWRFFAVSSDEAFKSIWPLFFLGLYTSGLIGTLLSNGFVLIFVLTLFFKLRIPKIRER